MKTLSEVFREAKFLLWDGHGFEKSHEYLYSCAAVGSPIVRDFSTNLERWEIQNQAMNYLKEALKDCKLDSMFKPAILLHDTELTDEQCQGARFMWLELMALECEDEESKRDEVHIPV